MAEKPPKSVEPWSPLGELDPLERWEGLRDFARGPSWFGRWVGSEGVASPAIDVSEDAGQFVVTAELPGCKAEDVHVEIHDRVLTIQGEKRSEREEKNETRRYVERRYGSFSRSFRLPANVEGDRIKARFADGVLTVEIPKTAESKPRTISIKT